MAANKTTANTNSVVEFLDEITDDLKKKDAFQLLEFLQQTTGYEPQMWGGSIVGFGQYHYKYASGREGDAPLVGFSPRKEAISIYLAGNYEDKELLLQALGKHKIGKGCLYIKKMDDINLDTLKKMVIHSVNYWLSAYPS
ncbi:DUF1801 domain-containing protein [Emticicia sp. 17c]|uniref:DUF1801 domain-containing protein n=1 Tax=Emticicia sp. 17c TaxID=3127704 RepID=UPI00301DCE5F